MKVLIFFFLSILFSQVTLAQTDVKTYSDYDKVFTRAETSPKFNGDLYNYIDSCLAGKVKPAKGSIKMQFIIDFDGLIRPNSVSVLSQKGKNIDDLKLVELITKMPAWTAAIQIDYSVTFQYVIIIEFQNGKVSEVRQVM